MLVPALFVLGNSAWAQRWTEDVSQAEEASLTRSLIGAIRAEDWLAAVRIADRFRPSPTSAFSQYQAFTYAMTGRLDLVADLQRAGWLPSAPLCDDEEPGLVYRDALETIVEAAALRPAVIIQEMHWEAQHRFLLQVLLPRLREEGFSYFAAEDFEGRPEAYATASYPREAPAFHSAREPVFADAVRTAIELGYRLIPYEASFPPPPEIEPQNFQSYRAEQQADNLYRRIFAADPEAKAIIYTGVGWAREAPHPDYPGDAPMVVLLKELSGIDPLTIDQTGCGLSASVVDSGVAVAFQSNGLAAVQGFPQGTFDLQVRHVSASYQRLGRADWLLRLDRKPVAIPDSLRQPQQLVIVEAHLDSEPAAASPIDRIYLGADEALPLLLPSGEFRITAQPNDGESVLIVVE
jgi:hypothetical protein